jgi:hypothetical protein
MFIAYVLVVVLLQVVVVDSARFSQAIPLNLGVHLFVDNQYLQTTSSLEFRNGLVEKNTDNPIVFPEHPWEVAVHFYTSFLQVPASVSVTGKPMYMIYYACTASYTIIFFGKVSVCVANSTDGVHWEKPMLWYYPFTANGTQPPQASNIVFETDVNEFLGSVFIDTRSGTPRSQLFKMTYENEPQRYVYVGTSPDGFNWTAGTARAHPLAGLSDTQTVMLYSPENSGEYVLYGRQNGPDLANSTVYCKGGNTAHRRVVVTVSSGDVYGPWSKPIEAFPLGNPDPTPCFDNYNPATLYYNGVYFLFSSAFWHWAEADSGAPIPRAASNDGVMDIRLAVSRTALGPFTFPSRDPFIPRGIGVIDSSCKLVNVTGSDRDAGFVFSAANGLLDPDFLQSTLNELRLNGKQGRAGSSDDNLSPWMYHVYWGSQTTHAGGGAFLGRYWPGAYSGIFKARVRREGYVALSTLTSSPTGYGWLLSQVLSLPGMDLSSATNVAQLQLRINAEIATAGFLSVQFEDGTTGNPISGYTFEECKSLHGNGIRQLLEWSRQNGTSSNVTYTTDLTPLVNYSGGIQMRIQMAHTKLYSWLLSYVQSE